MAIEEVLAKTARDRENGKRIKRLQVHDCNMGVIKFIEKYFWLIFSAGFVVGLFVPSLGKAIEGILIPLLMVVLFLTFLKVEVGGIWEYIKRPGFVGYIVFVYLFVIPAVVYLLLQWLDPRIAIGFLLLTAMPPGVVSASFTDIAKGNIALSLAVTVVGYFTAPLSVVALFFFLTGTSFSLDLWNFFQILVVMIVVPFVAAQIVRSKWRTVVRKTKKYYSAVNILLIAAIIYIVPALQSEKILAHPESVVRDVMWLYVLFIILHIIGYFMVWWRPKRDRIAVSVTKTYMNNSLAIVLAITFFDPSIALLVILSEVPFVTLLSGFRFVMRSVKG